MTDDENLGTPLYIGPQFRAGSEGTVHSHIIEFRPTAARRRPVSCDTGRPAPGERGADRATG